MQTLHNYPKARFFKCALQVNPASYSAYRGQTPLNEAEYNHLLLEHALEAGVEVIGLADHGCVRGVDAIRDLFSQHGLVVFPGFEIASSEKVHLVCLFDEATPTNVLNGYLGALGVDFQNPAAPVTKSANDIINYVDQQEGFVYAAHCTNEDGVLHRRMNHVWQHEKLLAAQIPGSLENLKTLEHGFFRKVFNNQEPAYERSRKMAAINAADVVKPEDIAGDNASCLIKMTQPSFTSFKQAFLDAESRVRLLSDRLSSYASAIEHMRVTGGYLDGLDVEFSDHLNAVIGGRGTGKSTLLECIRFAFELEPKTESARRQHRAVLDSNLGTDRGMVELRVRSAHLLGQCFTVSRKYGSSAVVTDAQEQVSSYRPQDLLPGLELYGQNEIYELTRDVPSRTRLIRRFMRGAEGGQDEKIGLAQQKLKGNRLAILEALAKLAELEAEVEQLPRLEEQAQQFKALGLDEKLKLIPKLEKEKQLNTRVKEDVQRMADALQVLRDSLPDTLFLSDTNLQDLPNAELLKQQRAMLGSFKSQSELLLEQLEQLKQTTVMGLFEVDTQLIHEHQVAEEQLEKSFKEIPANQGKTGRQIGIEYQNLLRRIETVRPQQQALTARQAQIDELYLQRKKYLLELEQLVSARSAGMQQSIKRLNRQLEQKVRLELQAEGNRKPLLDFLLACDLEGQGPKRLAWVLEQNFSALHLAEVIRQGEEQIIQAFGVSSAVAHALHRMTARQLLELEELLFEDAMEIQLNVTHESGQSSVPVFRSIESLSTGQQCTAILHILLLDNQDPLILDQPEDNLDNAFIAERIVTELRHAKLDRQFLFATHNANIPVFGDAEWIGVLSVEDGQGKILPEQQGAIDMPQVQALAADILEGGQRAFNQRREKYGFV